MVCLKVFETIQILNVQLCDHCHYWYISTIPKPLQNINLSILQSSSCDLLTYIPSVDGNAGLLPKIIDRHHVIVWLLRELPILV
jgi:hypothetical protein